MCVQGWRIDEVIRAGVRHFDEDAGAARDLELQARQLQVNHDPSIKV